MIEIVNNDANSFALNDVAYTKVFHALPLANQDVGIYNIYDTRLKLEEAHFSEFQVDGQTFPSRFALMEALVPVLFNNQGVGGVIEGEGSDIQLGDLFTEDSDGIHQLGGGTDQDVSLTFTDRNSLRWNFVNDEGDGETHQVISDGDSFRRIINQDVNSLNENVTPVSKVLTITTPQGAFNKSINSTSQVNNLIDNNNGNSSTNIISPTSFIFNISNNVDGSGHTLQSDNRGVYTSNSPMDIDSNPNGTILVSKNWVLEKIAELNDQIQELGSS